jgi:intein/homing endonuclease
MSKLNPCVTGNTKLWTKEGFKTFKELADAGDDVDVYCLDVDGNIKMSRMFHPRLSGHNVEIMKITLSDGTEWMVTGNHMFLTEDGYVLAEDLCEGEKIVTMKKDISLPEDIDDKDKIFTEYSGTKKGTVIKKCEVSGEDFECMWEEREKCTISGYEADLYNIKMKVNTVSDNYDYKTVDNVEFLGERTDVYNGTVAVYHNYFTIDENETTIVNQLNCGE